MSKKKVLKHGRPDDLTGHMPKTFETTKTEDNILEEWKERRQQRQDTQKDMDEIDAAQAQMENLLSETSSRLAMVHGGVNKMKKTISDSSITSNKTSDSDTAATKLRRPLKTLLKGKKDVVTRAVQTDMVGSDLETISETANELVLCQEAQDLMVTCFEEMKEKWLKVSEATKQIQLDYNQVLTESCTTCSLFQQHLHSIDGHLSALKTELQHSKLENKSLTQQLDWAEKSKEALKQDLFNAVAREEGTLNKVAFMEDETNYMRKELEEIREKYRKLNIEYQKLQQDKEQLMTDFVESRLKQTETIQKYMDELQAREEERRKFLNSMGNDSKMKQLMIETDRQTVLLEEKNQLAHEVEVLKAKSTAQDLHIDDLLKQLAALAKVVDAYQTYTEKSAMTEITSIPDWLHSVESYTMALNNHRNKLENGASAVCSSVSKTEKPKDKTEKESQRKEVNTKEKMKII